MFLTQQMSNITVTYRDGRVAQLEQVYIRGSKIRFLILPDMLKNAPMLKSMKNKNQGSGAGRGKAAILKAQGERFLFGQIFQGFVFFTLRGITTLNHFVVQQNSNCQIYFTSHPLSPGTLTMHLTFCPTGNMVFTIRLNFCDTLFFNCSVCRIDLLCVFLNSCILLIICGKNTEPLHYHSFLPSAVAARGRGRGGMGRGNIFQKRR